MRIGFFVLLISATQAFVSSNSRVGNAGESSLQQPRHFAPNPIEGSHPFQNHGGALQASGEASSITSDIKKNINPFFSASLLIALDVAFRQLFKKLAIYFPSSLGGCMALFATMLVLPRGQSIFSVLSPGAGLLAKWLPVFFVPSLITLPLVGSVGNAAELVKIFGVILVGFYFTLLTTAGSVVAIRKLTSSTKDAGQVAEDITQKVVNVADKASAPAKPFTDELTNVLRVVTAVSGALALVATKGKMAMSDPFRAIFFLSGTLHNFVYGARLPKAFTKIVHPLVTCSAITWGMGGIFAGLTGSSFTSMLKTYKTGKLTPMGAGAGDVLLFLLGPAVVSLAISMYDRRKLMRQNLKEVGTAVGVSSLGGLFGTAAAVRLLKIASPYLRLSLLSRNITSPLAMAIASILGADVSLAVAMVVVTGLIGANFGASILDSFGIHDPVARGLGIGAAAHGLGTAAVVNEEDAFPFAAISMALTATACTCLVSVPAVKKMVLQLALGGV